MILLFTSIFLTFGLLEIGVRLLGIKPANAIYKQVDQLKLIDSFKGFPDGSLRANPSYDGWKYGEKINSDGFRSSDLPTGSGTGNTVLLIGDSFAWGGAARPITKSFADLLRSKYKVANLGIPGVGPTQYKLLTENYVESVSPDVLILQFYMGNDLKNQPDPVIPGHPLYWITNAGWIWAFDKEGKPFSAEQAYHTYVDGGSYTKLRRVIFRSAVLSRLYFGFQPKASGLLNSIKNILDPSHRRLVADDKFHYTFKVLGEIATLAKARKIPFVLLVIPRLGRNCHLGKRYQVETYPAFDAFITIEPVLTDAHFTAFPDCHLNNTGHRIVATAIQDKLAQLR